MKAVKTLISILHEIVLDFVTVLFAVANFFKKKLRNVQQKLPVIPTFSLPAFKIQKYVPQGIKKRYTPYVKKYWKYLGELYTEADDALEDGYVPTFFIIAALFTIVVCCLIYYHALVS